MCPCCFNHGRQTHCPVVEKVQQSKHVQGTLENVEGALAETAGEYLDDVGSLSLSLSPFCDSLFEVFGGRKRERDGTLALPGVWVSSRGSLKKPALRGVQPKRPERLRT